MRRGRLVGLLLFAVSASAAAQGPSADWRTLSTAHFRIHFPEPFAAFAGHAAETLETTYPRVAERVGWAPALPIDVIVRDPRAAANGAAIPWLDRPQIILWAFPPDTESSTGRFIDWTEVLSVHELAHVAHLGRPAAGPLGVLARFSPAPFGPIALASPRWVFEGYATLIEGELTGSGRPGSAFRDMLLRTLALAGELPAYGSLSATSGWLSGSPAYLVGSAYLEWLAVRDGRERLPELWRAMSEGRGFDRAFRSVFGASPKDLYAAFVEETKARAREELGRLEDTGLVEGELLRRLDGGTASLSLSPDGTKLLARRDASPRSSSLAVWETEEPGAAPPRWTLPRANGYSASDPRWMPDGRDVLFARRAPDADGALVWDLYLWTPETGAVRRVTRGAGVADADPSPDGRFAVAVRNRFGISSLVRVDLATGSVAELPVLLGPEDFWRVWSHPRLSPDGTRIAALLHRRARWRLVTLAAEGGAIAELAVPGEPVASPAWAGDGAGVWIAADGSGIWNLYEIARDGGPAQARTRATGGAFSPAPSRNGREVFFLEFAADGVNIRRLDPAASEPVVLDVRLASAPLEAALRAPSSFAAVESPYDVWKAMVVRSLVGFSVGPSGSSAQVGVEGGDAVGRLRWLAAGSFGNAVGPRGGAIAAAWRASPLEAFGSLFSAIEKPGNQALAPRPALDQERAGGYVGLSWGRPFVWGGVRVEAGLGTTRVEAFSTGDRFWRSLGSTAARVSFRRTRGGFGAALEAEGQGAAGTTDEQVWSLAAGGAGVSAITPVAVLSARARTGTTGGAPTVFDVFAIGGASSTILPTGLDGNRVESPALPAAVQLGERFESFRAELEAEAFPVVLYAEWLRGWSGDERPPAIRVTGAEVRLERLIPSEADRRLTLRLGIGYVSSDAPRIRATRGYAGLLYRP